MKSHKKRFVTLFPYYEDYHFFKDPGQIPFRMQQYNYSVEIVCFCNSDSYSVTEQYVKLRKLNSPSHGKSFFLIFRYLILNAKKIEVLNLFHINWISLLSAFIYKMFNGNGLVYLKLDNNCFFSKYGWEVLLEERIPFYKVKKLIKQILFKQFFHSVNVFSVEDNESRNYYNRYSVLSDKIFVSYNGHTCDLFHTDDILPFSKKENIILTVGRLGEYPKNTQLLLSAFAEIAPLNDYDLHLAGSVSEELSDFLRTYFNLFPSLKDRIFFHGQLNKINLFNLYNRAKIFVLPSVYEGFANVFGESMYFGNAIVTTETVSAKELVRNKCGVILNEISSKCLSEQLTVLINDIELLNEYSLMSHKISQELNWDKIVNGIALEIMIIGKRKNIRINFFSRLFVSFYVMVLFVFHFFSRQKDNI